MVSFDQLEVKKMTLLDALKNYPKCRKLHLSRYSIFYGVISHAVSSKFSKDEHYAYGLSLTKRGKTHGKHPLEKVIVNVVFKGKTPIAWSWIFEREDQFLESTDPKIESRYSERSLAFMVRVDPKFQNLGIGKKLYFLNKEIAKKKHLSMSVFPHDPTSDKFYKSVKAKYIGIW
jgi:hypothetical protein